MTITLNNVPPRLHRVLEQQARQHNRSVDQEAIWCLEKALGVPAGTTSLARPPAPVPVGAILRFPSDPEPQPGWNLPELDFGGDFIQDPAGVHAEPDSIQQRSDS